MVINFKTEIIYYCYSLTITLKCIFEAASR